jgi:hypothetical protein
MAKDLRYRPLGAAIPSVPGVDFTTAANARARSYDAIGNALNAMSDYAYKKAVKQTEREAAKYAFENPVTAEQIQDAISQGRDLDEIVGDPDTVFGAVTTATAAQQLTTELEMEANKRIGEYSAAVKSGLLYQDQDITKMTSDLKAMITGHSEIIAGLDPEQALKYNASANASASTLYTSALEKQLEFKRATKIAAAEEFLAGMPDQLRDILTAPNVDMTAALAKVTDVARRANDAIINTGDLAFAKTKAAEIQQIVKDVQVGVLTDHVMNLPEKARISALRSGSMGALTPVYALLSTQDQAEFRANVRTEIAARQQADDQLEADELKIANQDLVVDVLNFATAEPGSDEEIAALQNIVNIGITTNGKAIDGQQIIALQKAKTKDADEEERNYTGELQILDLIFNDKITTLEELNTIGEEKGVGPKALLGLLPKMDKSIRDVERGVAAEARQHAQIVPGTINVAKKKEQAFASFSAKVDRLFADELSVWENQDEPSIADKPSKVKIAEDLRKKLLSSNYGKVVTNLVDGASKRLEQYGIEFTEYTTIQDIDSQRLGSGMSDTDYEFVRKKIIAIRKNADLRDELLND